MNKKWQLRFLRMASHPAGWSKDPGTPVGTIIVSPDRRRFAVGYNGPPQKLSDDKWQRGTRERKLMATIHAEVNAVLFCGFDTNGAWLFVDGLFPCTNCASVIVQKGIAAVVCWKEHMNQERWNPKEAMEILQDGGVKVYSHKKRKRDEKNEMRA